MIKYAAPIVAALSVSTPICLAQTWPSRNIEIILPTAAGSGPDVSIRAYTEKLAKRLGQSIVVNNRPGASGVIAAQAAARSQPDGYTFLLASPAQLIINKYVVKNMPYDPDNDFVPVSLLNRAPFVILINPKLGVKSLKDLAAYGKEQKRHLLIAYEGATGRATSAYLKAVTGLDLTLVPYVNAVQAIEDLIAGHVDLHAQGSALALPYVKNGYLQALAVTGGERFEQLPDVPAIGEIYPNFGNFESWLMVLAPKGTPDAIIRRMSEEIGRISQTDDMKRLFFSLGILPADSGSPDVAAKFLHDQKAQFAKMAEEAFLKPE